MRLLTNSYNTAEENLAFEEWYFQHFEEDSLRLWVNPPSVIVGKHQTALSESNAPYCIEHGIPIIRRFSGGGTVFHDQGNVNFSFFRVIGSSHEIDYNQNLDIIQDALSTLGINTQRNERHDLFLNNAKVSGNAQHISKGRALHHGTLLYDGNLEILRHAIKRSSGSFADKAVKSVRSKVTNIRSHHDLGDAQAFWNQLVSALSAVREPMEIDVSLPDDLMHKYSSESWNFGYGPAYAFSNEMNGVTLDMEVERGGKIVFGRVNNTSFEPLMEEIIGKQHSPLTIFNSMHFKSLDQGMKKLALQLFL